MTEPTPRPSDTPLTLRPFRNADAPAVARLVTASVLGHWTYGPEQFRETADPPPLPRRLVAEQAGEVVATASLAPFGAAAPDALRLGVAGERAAFTPLFLALLAELPTGYGRVFGVVREDFAPQMAFFGAAGFRNAWQSWGAHLDLRAFDFGPYRALEERLFLEGYEVAPLRATDPEADWAAVHALHAQAQAELIRNPTTTPDHLTHDELRAVVGREEAAFVVRWRGRIVALTRLTRHDRKAGRDAPHTASVDSEFTATHPDHRGSGVATLLKAHALAWAAATGYPEASTGGSVLNLPMLRVNTRLGYRTEPMWVTWEWRRPGQS